MQVAARLVSPDAIQTFTRSELNTRGRTDRSSIPSGEHVRAFGVRDFGEIATYLSGTATVEDGQGDARSFTIHSAEALKLPIRMTPAGLLSDLAWIGDVLKRDVPKSLAFLEHYRKVVEKETSDELYDYLRQQLEEHARGDTSGAVGLVLPHERLDQVQVPVGFKLCGRKHKDAKLELGLPLLAPMARYLTEGTRAQLPSLLSRYSVQLYCDAQGDEEAGPSIRFGDWLYSETTLKGHSYSFSGSNWYEVDTHYAGRVQARVDEVFAKTAPCTLPQWSLSTCKEERHYNQQVAAESEWVLCDRRLVATELHKHGFEACDLLTPDGALVHVKHVSDSTAFSHLAAQALVSAQALRFDIVARNKLIDHLSRHTNGNMSDPGQIREVVLVLAHKKKITSNSLFPFSRIVLARLDEKLIEMGFRLTTVSIIRS